MRLDLEQRMCRRIGSYLVAAVATLVFHATASAQPAVPGAVYPTKPLRLLVPLPPGGPSDYVARQVAQHLGTALGQPVSVENRPGANGLVAAREAAASPADGYTLLFAPGSMIAAPVLAKVGGFDWREEFAPLGKVARVPFALAVHPDVPATTVAELVRLARQQPDRLNVATSTPSEVMAAAQFMKAGGVRLTRVAYKGGTQALPDLLAGRVHAMFGPLSLMEPHARSGTLRLLATLTRERVVGLESVPTMSESGLDGVDVPTWQAVYVSAKAAPAIRARLTSVLAAHWPRPEVRAEFDRRLLVVEAPSADELAATIARELVAWAALVDEFKLAAD